MVRNLLPLFEILSILYGLAAVYGKKLKYNIYVVIFIVAEMVLMIGINDYGIPKYFITLSYALMFVYCWINYKISVINTLINIFITAIVLGVLQLLVYSILVILFKDNDINNLKWEIIVLAVNLVIVILGIPKLHLERLAEFLSRKQWMTILIGVVVVAIFGVQLWKIKQGSSITGEDLLFTVYFYILLFLLLIEWQKTRLDAEKRKVQLEINKLYYDTYEELIMSIRKKQHDFNNHINAIQGILYTAVSYEELRDQEEKYLNEITQEHQQISILTKVENPLIAGFLTVKIQEAERKGINVEHNCIFPKAKINIPEYQLIEMMGILLDNAIEAVEQMDTGKQIQIQLLMAEGIASFSVTNTYLVSNVKENFLQKDIVLREIIEELDYIN
jgi:signal transduction histidine kinase